MFRKDPFKRILLPSGAVLLVAPLDSKDARVSVYLKNGSQYERKQEGGIAHCVEHYLFRGNRGLPDHRQIQDVIRSIQGDFIGWTSLEGMAYAIKAPIRNFSKCLEVASNLVLYPTFKGDELEFEKKTIIQEIGTALDKPSEYVENELWYELAFGDQPAGRPVAGTEETVNAITKAAMERHYKTHYVGKAMVVVVAGGEDLYKFLPDITDAFKDIRPGEAGNPYPVIDKQKRPRMLIRKKDTALAHLCLGVKSPIRAGDNDNGDYAATILSSVINYNLFLSMVERGLSYEGHTIFEADSTKGVISTYAGVSHDRVLEAVRIILEEYQRMRDVGVSSKDFGNTIGDQIAGLEEHGDDPGFISAFLSSDEITGRRVHTLKEEIKIIKLINREQVNEVARRAFLPSNLCLSVLGPVEDSDGKIKEVLNRF